MKIRVAQPEDAKALLAIYAQYIETPVTFEYTLPSEAEFRDRIVDTLQHYPYLVVEEEGRILGYAYAHALRERLAYQWTTELSVYLDRDARGRGLGREVSKRLLALLQLQGVRSAYGCVTAPNLASEAMQRGLGFQCTGVFHRCGYKDGQWRDVLWFEKLLGAFSLEPKPIVPFQQLEEKQVRAILDAQD